ncbi:TPA: hypothetical protein N0F65_009670 [Lagenidium giganteum]|uniref:Uncharacterized protein n=1 Tax=Lagenidium giganteum TaxID=4803 RepID=A0AAV2YWN8_9STRA|nr:TPA: hypothetical protein N0F65_009670 [Lagenidium giganteum]
MGSVEFARRPAAKHDEDLDHAADGEASDEELDTTVDDRNEDDTEVAATIINDASELAFDLEEGENDDVDLVAGDDDDENETDSSTETEADAHTWYTRRETGPAAGPTHSHDHDDGHDDGVAADAPGDVSDHGNACNLGESEDAEEDPTTVHGGDKGAIGHSGKRNERDDTASENRRVGLGGDVKVRRIGAHGQIGEPRDKGARKRQERDGTPSENQHNGLGETVKINIREKKLSVVTVCTDQENEKAQQFYAAEGIELVTTNGYAREQHG